LLKNGIVVSVSVVRVRVFRITSKERFKLALRLC